MTTSVVGVDMARGVPEGTPVRLKRTLQRANGAFPKGSFGRIAYMAPAGDRNEYCIQVNGLGPIFAAWREDFVVPVGTRCPRCSRAVKLVDYICAKCRYG